MINQISAKQYKIPIKYKNELLSINEYKEYEKIDMVGFNDSNKIDEKVVKLYYKLNGNFYLNVKEGFENRN